MSGAGKQRTGTDITMATETEAEEEGCLEIADDTDTQPLPEQLQDSGETKTRDSEKEAPNCLSSQLQDIQLFAPLLPHHKQLNTRQLHDTARQGDKLPEGNGTDLPVSRVTVYTDTTAPDNSLSVDTNTLKNTINQVFWEKINNHVEELLNNLENEKQVECSEEADNISGYTEVEARADPCKKVNRLLREADQHPSQVPRNQYSTQSSNQRKSMLEISSVEIEDNLISVFRRSMHCTDSCVIRVVDRSGISRQSHFNRTIPMVCIDRSLLQDNAARIDKYNCLRITRMRNSESIEAFKNTDVFAKRSVIRGGDILRTLAVYEMREKFDFQEQSYLDKESRKVMYNKFTNMQRLDRGVGSRLKWQFMDRHNIEETDTIEQLEEKAAVSFSIFGPDGCLIYESKRYQLKHVTMIKDTAGLYYFIPQKMLGAFGSQWTRRKRSCRQTPVKTTKICRNVLSSPLPMTTPPLICDVRLERSTEHFSEPDKPNLGFNPLRMRFKRETSSSECPQVNTKLHTTPLYHNVPPPTRNTELCIAVSKPAIVSKAGDTAPTPAPTDRCVAGVEERRSTRKQGEVRGEGGLQGRSKTDNVPALHRSAPAESTQHMQYVTIPRTKPDVAVKHTNISNQYLTIPRPKKCPIETFKFDETTNCENSRNLSNDSKKRSAGEVGSRPVVIKKVANLQNMVQSRVFAKGEVLLTTKDHIILRIPRNLDIAKPGS